jgi:hypothetical protein
MASMRAFHRSRPKTQPVCWAGQAQKFQAELCRLLSAGPTRLRAIGFVAFSQLIDQMYEIRRHIRRIRAKYLSKPFANGVADRSAGFMIEQFDIVCAGAFHDRFRS